MNVRISCLALALSVPLLGSSLAAAEPAPAEADLKAKEAEVQKLKDELRARENELEKLRRENESLREEKEREKEKARKRAAEPAPAAAPAAPPEPSRPLDTLMQPTPDDAVEATDLVAYFISQPAAAAEKFAGRTFLVRGKVARLEGVLLQRKFQIEFDSPNLTPRVTATLVMPADWDGVFAARNGASLVRRGDLGNQTLMQRGDSVVVRARCEGLKKDEIRFDRGELVRGKQPGS